VQRLEDELGQPLLERDNRSVRLTGAGREFREYARYSVAEWQQLRRKLGNEDQLAGEVSLYCSVTATYSVLAPILEAFRASHPAVEIKMHTGDQADGIDRILQGRDDVAVSGRPSQVPRRMEFLPLLESPLQFCIPSAECAVRDMVLAADKDNGEIDWSGIPFIVPERGITKEMLDAWFREQGIRPRIYAQVAGHEAIVAMVSLGLGVGIAPQLVIEASGMSSRVSQISVPAGLPALTVGLCSLGQRLASPLVKSFWDVAGQTYSQGV
jgi:LysR family positive regulator for ilvC